jgi:5-methyltetrahydrofolate--homocysteine methyltransferase
LAIFNALFDPAARPAFVARNRQEQQRLAAPAGPAPAAPAAAPASTAPIHHDLPAPVPPDLDLHQVDDLDAEAVYLALDPQMLFGKHLGLKGAVARLFAAQDPKALELRARLEQLWREARAQGLLRPRAAYRFCPCQADGDRLLLYSGSAEGRPLASFDFPRQANGERLCLADFAAPKSGGRMDYVALFVVSTGAGIREEAARLREAGEYFKSHALSALALESAEAAAQVLHDRIRALWGIGPRGQRFSFGYPACPALEPQARLLELLDSRRSAGVTLTDGLMMDPEASVSAIVFHHSQARVFSAATQP